MLQDFQEQMSLRKCFDYKVNLIKCFSIVSVTSKSKKRIQLINVCLRLFVC